MTSHDGPSPAAGPDDEFEAELRALGEAIDLPDAPAPERTARAVRARLESLAPSVPPATPGGPANPEEPAATVRPGAPPSRRRRPRRLLIAAAVVAAVAALVAATPQGRAAVVQILRFAGVEVRVGEQPVPPATPQATPPLPGERRVSLEEARRAAPFPIAVPRELGEPDEVRLSDGGRVVTLLWPGMRLDEYDGRLDAVFRKELGPPFPEEAGQGWWIPRHHALTYLPRRGGPVTFDRLAGPTLIWQHGSVGLRLEGAENVTEALRIMRSAG
ncbi:hypothetical protein [Spongiactinospora sp. TRM90649]|uniref:hypothetical protein n=1 Tax=Spongiactinospora sp. TRM90649 TaxID=3031114 RepID=UPI0023F6E96B|nr:hypothetical protein [Spongiactinospora sp. TRM90649]MDF5751573.1 hypothetical protein [Spongiactinospora sp. TRM90649]